MNICICDDVCVYVSVNMSNEKQYKRIFMPLCYSNYTIGPMTTILALSCIFARRALASRVVTAVFRPCYRVVCWRCQHLAEGVPDAVARQQPMQRFSSCFFTLKRHVQVVILVRKFISACFWSWIRWQLYRRNFLSPADCVLIGGRMSLFESLVLSTFDWVQRSMWNKSAKIATRRGVMGMR